MKTDSSGLSWRLALACAGLTLESPIVTHLLMTVSFAAWLICCASISLDPSTALFVSVDAMMTDLPKAAQDKIASRDTMRSKLSDLRGIVGDSDDLMLP